MAYKDEIVKTEIPFYVELIDIIFPELTFYITNYQNEIIYKGKTYKRAVYERSEFERAVNDEIQCSIVFATQESILPYVFSFTAKTIKCIIRRYFPSLDLAKTIFVGDCIGVGIVDSKVLSARFVDKLSMMKKKIPDILYQSYCNNMLYDRRCGVDKLAYRYTATVSYGSNSAELLSATFGAVAEHFFTYGKAEYQGEIRMITYHNKADNKIRLHFPFEQDINGKQIVVYAGCDKTASTCKNKFNNIQNFLGFPYIPSRNPVLWGV